MTIEGKKHIWADTEGYNLDQIGLIFKGSDLGVTKHNVIGMDHEWVKWLNNVHRVVTDYSSVLHLVDSIKKGLVLLDNKKFSYPAYLEHHKFIPDVPGICKCYYSSEVLPKQDDTTDVKLKDIMNIDFIPPSGYDFIILTCSNTKTCNSASARIQVKIATVGMDREKILELPIPSCPECGLQSLTIDGEPLVKIDPPDKMPQSSLDIFTFKYDGGTIGGNIVVVANDVDEALELASKEMLNDKDKQSLVCTNREVLIGPMVVYNEDGEL